MIVAERSTRWAVSAQGNLAEGGRTSEGLDIVLEAVLEGVLLLVQHVCRLPCLLHHLHEQTKTKSAF